MDSQKSSTELEVDSNVKQSLKSASGWFTFLSILGFISCISLVLSSLVMIAVGERYVQGAAITGGAMLVMVGLLVFPLYHLFRFSNKVRSAMATNQQLDFVKAFQSLKAYAVLSGIAVIASIALSIIMVIIMVVKRYYIY